MGKAEKDKLVKLEDRRVAVEHDCDLLIATGASRFARHWKNRQIRWSQLLARLQHSLETPETHAQYMQMAKSEQDRIKDIGGFVGGRLRDGKRKNGYVEGRQLITLDADFAPADLAREIMDSFSLDCAMALYSTHKHTSAKPRLRLVIPLDREVTADEYEAIARKVAEHVGIDWFDDSTYQSARLMYWPSHSADVEPYFWHYDADLLQADKILAEYPDWTDISYWPMSSRARELPRPSGPAADPLSKRGPVGAFCRTYTVTEAIRKFLPEIYIPTDKEDRWTYAAGSTAAGLVIYNDNTFAWSNHATDPAAGRSCNAFDLVRIHLYGSMDEDADDKTGRSLPSYKAMTELVREDEDVRMTLAKERRQEAVLDFQKEEEDPGDWEKRLTRTPEGGVEPSVTNAVLILQNCPELKPIAWNELTGAIEVRGPLPWPRPGKYWRDADESQLYAWVADNYGVQFSDTRFSKALQVTVDGRRFNPLRDYILGLPDWDGVERVDSLLVDYLGAEDVPYVRAVTRKTLVGAVKRVLEPGCKFDTVLVLDGAPGIGKSTLLRKLGGEWFSDSLSLADTRDKTAAEKLQGVWIMEIGEMQGTRKADTDILKGFLSTQVDEYRRAYGRVVERHPRTAIICGTTNSTTGFLRDVTGNRRFWPVVVWGSETLSVWDMTEEVRDQIWAEAYALYLDGEEAYLDAEMEKEAYAAQKAALEYDDREGLVIDYLNTLLPEDWYSWDRSRRMDWFSQGDDELDATREQGTLLRSRVSALEIFCECFKRPDREWRTADGREIAAIMARIPGWSRTGETARISGYGKQRVFTRTGGADGSEGGADEF